MTSKPSRVIAVKGNQASIQVNCFTGAERPEEEPCFGCLKIECKDRKKTVTAGYSGGNLDPGELLQVNIEINLVLLFSEILAALGAPVLGFITGFFFTALFFPGSRESARAAAGALLMFTAAFCFYQFRRRFPAKNPYRVIH